MTSGRDLTQLSGRPTVGGEQAAALLRHWGLRGTVRELVSERDQNWLVEIDGMPAYVLKIANAADGPEPIDLQQALMRRLGAAAVPCPPVHPTSSGAPWVRVGAHLAWLIGFLPGVPLAGVRDPGTAVFESLGEVVGRSAVALAGFDHPAAHGRDLQWDVTHAQRTLQAHVGAVRGRARQDLVRDVLAQVRRRLAPALAALPHSVIHNDANDHNVLVSGGRVAGLIDFGDAVHTATVNDLAIACAYAMLDRPDPRSVATAVVAGYARHRTLTDLERDVLPLLVRVRLATSVAISARQQRLHPDNDYLRVSEAPAWRLLEREDGFPL